MNDDLTQLNEMWNHTTGRCGFCDGNKYLSTPDGYLYPCDWCSDEPSTSAFIKNVSILGALWAASWAGVFVIVYAGYRAVRWIWSL